MKLFAKLTEEERNVVIEYCVNIILDDFYIGDIPIDEIFDKDDPVKQKVIDAIEFVKTIEDEQEKCDYVMGHSEEVAHFIIETAIDLARGAYFKSKEELVICPEELLEDRAAYKEEHPETVDDLMDIKPKNKSGKNLN